MSNADLERLAWHQTSERIAARQRLAPSRRPRPRGRHALASRLHALAERLDR